MAFVSVSELHQSRSTINVIMKTESYLRLILILFAVCVLSALVYQIAQERKRLTRRAIGFTARPFVALETKQKACPS